MKFDDGAVELTGAGSPEALHKAVLIAGNAMGVAKWRSPGRRRRPSMTAPSITSSSHDHPGSLASR